LLYERHYNHQLYRLVEDAFQEKTWYPWLFHYQDLDETFWSNEKYQRLFLDWAAIQLKISKHDHWYKISTEEIKSLGGSMLLSLYGDSLVKLLWNVYSDIDWKIWLFESTPIYFWEDVENQMKFVEWLAEHLLIEYYIVL
jgi:hypothetical protein